MVFWKKDTAAPLPTAGSGSGLPDFGGASQPPARARFSGVTRKVSSYSIHTLREYYIRRQADGKSKMAIINIIRNKLVARVFAVVKRGTPFVDMKRYAAR